MSIISIIPLGCLGGILVTFGGAGMEKGFWPAFLIHSVRHVPWGARLANCVRSCLSNEQSHLVEERGICSKMLQGKLTCGQGLQKPARNVPQFVHYTKTTSRRGDSAQHGARSTGKKELLFLITKMPPPCSLTCGNWIQMCCLNTAQRHPDRVQWGG